ncbi:hypothetical protein AALP_AAs53234U000100 [Arabis alpina]|uniref:Uncharacterized protein n=1 Tax=Arabis alpina TaxID=50452 RepID=A0A087FYP3_ARAAL|nr:hypothetical protein AALP_AAs53234U000100 [Arabis alpina]
MCFLEDDGVFRIDRLESLITKGRPWAKAREAWALGAKMRTETALVQKPMEGTDSKIVMKQILVFTFTEQGSFVRELQEDPERCILEAEAFMKLVLAEVDTGVKTLSPCRC